MSDTTVCGVWPTTRRLIAAVERDGRLGMAASITRTIEARWGFVTWLVASEVSALVTADTLVGDELLAMAREAGIEVWLAPTSLVEAVRAAAGLTRRPPRQTAGLLARWLAQSALRQHLHRIDAEPPLRQLHLW